jgi:hypothetical protein
MYWLFLTLVLCYPRSSTPITPDNRELTVLRIKKESMKINTWASVKVTEITLCGHFSSIAVTLKNLRVRKPFTTRALFLAFWEMWFKGFKKS